MRYRPTFGLRTIEESTKLDTITPFAGSSCARTTAVIFPNSQELVAEAEYGKLDGVKPLASTGRVPNYDGCFFSISQEPFS